MRLTKPQPSNQFLEDKIKSSPHFFVWFEKLFHSYIHNKEEKTIATSHFMPEVAYMDTLAFLNKPMHFKPSSPSNRAGICSLYMFVCVCVCVCVFWGGITCADGYTHIKGSEVWKTPDFDHYWGSNRESLCGTNPQTRSARLIG